MANSKESITFEQALKELEEVSAALENGDVLLEESIKLFERGIYLSGVCSQMLSKAKQKIISLTDAESEEKTDE